MPLDDLSGAVSTYDQNSSDFLYRIFAETRDGKTCMSPVVFDTKNVKITNPKTWPTSRPRPINVQDIKDKPGGKA